MIYALRGAYSLALKAWPAQMTQPIAPRALIALVFRGPSFHDPFHELSGTGAHYGSRGGARSAPARTEGRSAAGEPGSPLFVPLKKAHALT
jgi:hypothetical protein